MPEGSTSYLFGNIHKGKWAAEIDWLPIAFLRGTAALVTCQVLQRSARKIFAKDDGSFATIKHI